MLSSADSLIFIVENMIIILSSNLVYPYHISRNGEVTQEVKVNNNFLSLMQRKRINGA